MGDFDLRVDRDAKGRGGRKTMGEGKLDTCDDLCHNAKSRREANISEWRGKGRKEIVRKMR